MFEAKIVEFREHTYEIGKLSAMQQLHVTRRAAPIFAALGSLSDLSLDAALIPISTALAGMADKDVEFIMATTLSVVRRKLPNGNGWAGVWNKQANQPQYEDINLSDMLFLAKEVMQLNVGSFLGGMGETLPAPAQP